MDADKLNQYAELLALCAVKRDSSGLEKIAAEYQKQAAIDIEALKGYLANPYVRNSLIGAGAGGLIGMLQPRRKGRNALMYALMGGLGGLGTAALFNQFGGQKTPETTPPAAGSAPGAAPGADTADASKMTLEEASKARDAAKMQWQQGAVNPYVYSGVGAAGGTLGGAAMGYTGGQSAGAGLSNLLGRMRPRGKEFNTLLGATEGLSPDAQAVQKGLSQVQERFRNAPGNANNVALFADDLATSAHPLVTDAVRRNFGTLNPTKVQQSASQLAKEVQQIVNTGRLGGDRALGARRLSQAQDLLAAQASALKPLKKGQRPPRPAATGAALGEQQILGALNATRNKAPVMPKFLPRVGGLLGGGLLGWGGYEGGRRLGGNLATSINSPLDAAWQKAQQDYQAAGGK